MKLNKFSFLIVIILLLLGACTDPDNLVPTNSDWNGTEFPVGGGLLELSSAKLNYVVGDAKDYTVELSVKQAGSNTTTKVDVYSSFYTYKKDENHVLVLDEDGNKIRLISNEVLLKSITITEKLTHFISFSFNYADLIKDLMVDGEALPASDGGLSIGDYWNLRFVSTVEDGNQYQNYQGASVTVSTRFAGTYICTEMAYYRLGVLKNSYWLGEELSIESVDAITYKYNWGEPIDWEGPLYLQIDPATNAITYPETWDGVAQTLNAQPLTCLARNPNDLTNAATHTTTPDIAIKDDVNGEDKLIMVYGYYTGGSGPREFYETLVKKVN
jgi:hypothetical protein